MSGRLQCFPFILGLKVAVRLFFELTETRTLAFDHLSSVRHVNCGCA